MSSVASHSIPKADGHWLLGSAKEFAHAPHCFVAELGRQKGSLAKFRVLHKSFLATASPEVAYQVLVSHRERYERGEHYRRLATVTGNGLLVSEGAKWRNRHRLIQPLLRGEHLRRLVPTVCDSVREVLKDWETKRVNGAPIEVVGETQRLTISAIGRMLLSTNIGRETASRLGTALREAMLLLRQHNTSLFALPLGCPVHRNRRLHGHSQVLDRFIESHVEGRRKRGQPETKDFLSVLMEAEDPDSGEKLPQRAVIDETKTLFLGGFETTSSVMAWTLYLLASHPEHAGTWHEEIDGVLQGRTPQWEHLPRMRYTVQVLNEAMRLYPPAHTLARQCMQGDEIAGYKIPKLATILISVYGIHRSDVWGSDPEKFRPERFAQDSSWPRRAYLPFATGKHICVGNEFAMTEMIATLSIIGQRYRLVRANREPVEAKAQITLVPAREIPIYLEVRK
jgi:cytochrome P450